jgi:hypothetical protein
MGEEWAATHLNLNELLSNPNTERNDVRRGRGLHVQASTLSAGYRLLVSWVVARRIARVRGRALGIKLYPSSLREWWNERRRVTRFELVLCGGWGDLQ